MSHHIIATNWRLAWAEGLQLGAQLLLLPTALPRHPISIVLDGIIGLIPGFGDLLTNVFGALNVLRAMQHAHIARQSSG